jgi:hypothetical protein
MRTIKPYTKKGRPFIMRDMSCGMQNYNSPGTGLHHLILGRKTRDNRTRN